MFPLILRLCEVIQPGLSSSQRQSLIMKRDPNNGNKLLEDVAGMKTTRALHSTCILTNCFGASFRRTELGTLAPGEGGAKIAELTS